MREISSEKEYVITMETKTLEIIQKLSKIGKVLSKIIEVFCIVGAVFCLIGIISLSVGNFEAFKIGGVTVHSIIEESAGMSIGTMYASMSVGLIMCIAEVIITKIAGLYFKNEIAAGTPFTMDGAKEMLRLGICTIAISVGSLIVADITYNVLNKCFDSVADMSLDNASQVGIGIAFIIVSLLCKYGALREKSEEVTVEE